MASIALHQNECRPDGRYPARRAQLALLMLLLALFLHSSRPASAGALSNPASEAALPDAPDPQSTAPAAQPAASPCDVKNAGGSMVATAAVRAADVAANGTSVSNPKVIDTVLCVPHLPIINWYARFLNGPQVKALTPLQKAHLAGRNLVDPFNLLTIGGEAAISVAANSHSVYGPGFAGWGKYMGVSFTQDMVGEFFGTFLIPSIAHEDPHYHRLPSASVKRRILHAAYQIAWTQGDDGKGMLNYSDLVGFAVEDAVNDLYVPGQQTNLHASVRRYGITLALAPIDNYITEFLPDIASRIHVRVVLVQRIINQVAVSKAGGAPAQ
ncbi:MAG TPA: hypothetical protein VFB43_05895 [Terracidiphilus sp.]|nr:hypothetical protein [Terracidiphilus sp.]